MLLGLFLKHRWPWRITTIMSTKGVEIQAEEEAGATGGKGAEDGGLNLGQPHMQAEDAVGLSLGETAMMHENEPGSRR